MNDSSRGRSGPSLCFLNTGQSRERPPGSDACKPINLGHCVFLTLTLLPSGRKHLELFFTARFLTVRAFELSTNPLTMNQKSEGMMTWFPFYFPLKVRFMYHVGKLPVYTTRYPSPFPLRIRDSRGRGKESERNHSTLPSLLFPSECQPSKHLPTPIKLYERYQIQTPLYIPAPAIITLNMWRYVSQLSCIFYGAGSS